MDQLEHITQAYSQAPWRKQWQIIGLVSLILVLTAMIAGVYLSISTQATSVGRDIQSMQSTTIAVDRENEDLQSQLASILSSSEMEGRARSLGFVPIPPDQIVYLNVPGYEERQPIIMAPSNDRSVVGARYMPPEYTESIFEWLAVRVRQWYSTMIEVQP
jgi:cell division protein FtsL